MSNEPFLSPLTRPELMAARPAPVRILLVDDDVVLVSLLRDYLQQDGFAVSTVPRGEEALMCLAEQPLDLVVLDIMMPGIGGIETLRRLRAQYDVPVLMLTARGDDMDRILGLELGADDYVPKPCLPRELAARIRAILRRAARPVADAGGSEEKMLDVGDLRIYPAQRRAELAGVRVELTSTEFNLLVLLARQAGRPVSKAQLSEGALGRPLERFDRSIDVHMHSIRRKLGQLADGQSRIGTVYRQGYQLHKPDSPPAE